MGTRTLFRKITPKSLTLPSFRSLSIAATLAGAASTLRTFSTRAATTTSSLNDRNPNWSNRPPKETILLDGCDFEHWLVVVDKPQGEPVRDQLIDLYIKTLAKVVGSEEEARMKIYSVSTKHYYAFGALVSEELSNKLTELEGVRWVLPDSYLNVREKDYGGEPFVNGQAVPYDPKYHQEWVRNNALANQNKGRYDKRRKYDRPGNFDRRRENVMSRDMQDRPPMPNQGIPAAASNTGGFPSQNAAGHTPHNTGGYPPQNAGGYPPQNSGGYPPLNPGYPPQNAGGYPPQNAGGGYPPQSAGGYPPQNAGSGFNSQNAGGGYNHQNAAGGGYPPHNAAGGYPPPNAAGGYHPQNAGGVPPNQNMGGFQQNAGWSSNAPGRDY